jgi:hypothetical protein
METRFNPKLRDVLSHLKYTDVKKILGAACDKLLREGGRMEIDLESQVRLDNTRMRLELGKSVAVLRLSDGGRRTAQKREARGLESVGLPGRHLHPACGAGIGRAAGSPHDGSVKNP